MRHDESGIANRSSQYTQFESQRTLACFKRVSGFPSNLTQDLEILDMTVEWLEISKHFHRRTLRHSHVLAFKGEMPCEKTRRIH